MLPSFPYRPAYSKTKRVKIQNSSDKHYFAAVCQGEESRGYQELVVAAKRVESVPVAFCSAKEVWTEYSLSSGTITLFRKVLIGFFLRFLLKKKKKEVALTPRAIGARQADEHQENLVVDKAKKLDADGLVNFITINEVRYLTEYNQVVGGDGRSSEAH